MSWDNQAAFCGANIDFQLVKTKETSKKMVTTELAPLDMS